MTRSSMGKVSLNVKNNKLNTRRAALQIVSTALAVFAYFHLCYCYCISRVLFFVFYNCIYLLLFLCKALKNAL